MKTKILTFTAFFSIFITFAYSQNSDYPYLLPVKQGQIVKAFGIGSNVENEPRSISFKYIDTDTIYAIRSGKIINDGNKEGHSYTMEGDKLIKEKTKDCQILVKQKDDTYLHYICIPEAKSLVKKGDRLIAGQPIAVFSKKTDMNSVGFYLFKLNNNQRKTLVPKFYTEEGVINVEIGKHYTGITPPEIISKELSKKEKKKLNFK